MNRFKKLLFGLSAACAAVTLCSSGALAQVALNALVKPIPHALPYAAGVASIVSDKGTPKWCTDTAWQAADPLKHQLQDLVDQVEQSRDGGYPNSISLPSARGARVNFIYHKAGPSYAIALGSIHDTALQYIGALHDIMACSTVYAGNAKEIAALGLYVPEQKPHTPFLYYAPHLGLYYLSERP